MKLLKSFIIALSLALSLGGVSSTAIAAGPPSAASSVKAINLVLEHVAAGIKAIDNGETSAAVKEHIRTALRESKEITGAELLEKKRLKASRSLKKARSALKKGDTAGTKSFLEKTAKDFETLKKYI